MSGFNALIRSFAPTGKPQRFRTNIVERTLGMSRVELFSRASDADFTSHGDQAGLLDGASSQKEAEAAIIGASSVPDERPKTMKLRVRKRKCEFPLRSLVVAGCYRVIVLDVAVEQLPRVDLSGCQDAHCFLLVKVDLLRPLASLQAFGRSGFDFKTSQFTIICEADDAFVQIWAVGTSKSTRITQKDPLIKRKHIAQIIPVDDPSEALASLMSALETVFGTDVARLCVGATRRVGWDSAAPRRTRCGDASES